MDPLWRKACLLFVLLAMPVLFATFSVGTSRRQQGRLVSYLAYYLLFGIAGQWLLALALWPSDLSRVIATFLLTAAPVVCLGLAVALQRAPSRLAFDNGALVTCYLYPLLAAAGAACAHFGVGR